MRECPSIPTSDIASAVASEFRMAVTDVRFLRVGFDVRTAAYEVRSKSDSWFLKIRTDAPRGSLARDLFSRDFFALVPHLLWSRGCAGVIPPHPTFDNQLSFPIGPHRATLSPFVEGCNAYDREIPEGGWETLADTLTRLHSLDPELLHDLAIPVERFGPEVRDAVRAEMNSLDGQVPRDVTAEQTLGLLLDDRSRINELAGLCDHIARNYPEPSRMRRVLCHSDVHAGNLHIGSDGRLYVVDWDELIVAPPERDLMYIGGGLLSTGLTPSEECSLFYRSYTEHEPSPDLLVYYRVQRVLADIVEFCRLIFGNVSADEDRAASLTYLRSTLSSGGTIDHAMEGWE